MPCLTWNNKKKCHKIRRRISWTRSMKYKYFKEGAHYLETMRFLKVSSHCFVIIIFCNSKKKILNDYWGIVNILPDFCYIFIRRRLFLVSLNRVKILNKCINKLLNNTWKLIVGCLGILKGLEMKNSQESLHNKTTEKRTHMQLSQQH